MAQHHHALLAALLQQMGNPMQRPSVLIDTAQCGSNLSRQPAF